MIYQFDDLELDIGRRQLTRDGNQVKLTKLNFKVLHTLVEASPNLVPNDELVDKVWGSNRVISPENLSQRLLMLRQSISDDVHQPRYIGTVRAQGYRLIPQVTVVSEQAPKASEQNSPISNWSWLSIAALVAIVVAALLLAIRGEDGYQREPAQRDSNLVWNSVAVLPFSNLSPDPNNSFYASGIHEEVLNQLAKLTSLRVISRTSMLRYENTRKTIPSIAKELKVDSVVEGSVRYANNRIRITVQLVDGASDEHLWSETYDRELKDLFIIESEIAREVAIALHQIASNTADFEPKGPPTKNLQAYTEYAKGRELLLMRQPAQLLEALARFQHATDLDPNYVLAWVGQADAEGLHAEYARIEMTTTVSSRQNAIDTALALDPTSGEAWLAQAELRMHQHLLEEAEKYYKRSIELIPGNAQAYHWYAGFLSNYDRPEDALPIIRRALELDPLAPTPNMALAVILWQLGRVEESLALYRKTANLNPNHSSAFGELANRLYTLGRLDEANYWIRQASRSDSPAFPATLDECNYLLNLGQDIAAEACRDKLIAKHPERPDLKYWPELYLFRNNGAAVLALTQENVEREPSPAALNALAMAHLFNGNLDEPLAIFKQLFPRYFTTDEITPQPSEFAPSILSGYVLFRSGSTDRANYLFNQASLRMDSMHRTRGQGYGIWDIVIHATRDDTDKALAALRSAIDSGWRQDWWRLRGPLYEKMREEPSWRDMMTELEDDIKQQAAVFEKYKDNREYWRCRGKKSC